MANEDTDSPLITQEVRSSWHAYLEEFNRDFYPIVAEHGFTRAEALVLWKLNEILNTLREILDEVTEDEE